MLQERHVSGASNRQSKHLLLRPPAMFQGRQCLRGMLTSPSKPATQAHLLEAALQGRVLLNELFEFVRRCGTCNQQPSQTQALVTDGTCEEGILLGAAAAAAAAAAAGAAVAAAVAAAEAEAEQQR